MNILSVDWDYFFPDFNQYDWGAREDDSFLFFEKIWYSRVYHINLFTKQSVLDECMPDQDLLKDFWQKYCKKHPKRLIITDQHRDIFSIFKFWGQAKCVVNFDQHFDWKHEKLCKEPQSCCWAYYAMRKGLMKDYSWIPSPWVAKEYLWTEKGFDEEITKKCIVKDIKGFKDINLSDICFDLVFICRSSAWTSPWADDKFLEFISYWKCNKELWDGKVILPYVNKARDLNMESAKKLRKEMNNINKELNIRKGLII